MQEYSWKILTICLVVMLIRANHGQLVQSRVNVEVAAVGPPRVDTSIVGGPAVSVAVESPRVDAAVAPPVASLLPLDVAVHVPVVTVTHDVQLVSEVQLTEFAAEANSMLSTAENQDILFFKNGIDKPVSEGGIPFGPHLLTSDSAQGIGKIGSVFVDISLKAATSMRLDVSEAGAGVSGIEPTLLPQDTSCPFINVTCNATYPYRTFDGSCNNLVNTLWGRAETPFERIFPPMYGDGISTPRTLDFTNTNPLPGARTVSTTFHEFISDLMVDITHFSMEFGQFISHDMQRNALSKGYLGSNIDCCNPAVIGFADAAVRDVSKKFVKSIVSGGRDACFRIDLPTDDAYFSQFNRTCMNFVRALPTPNLQCTLGPREQLNQNTHFIDGSQIYGSDSVTANSLRGTGGKLLSTGSDDLLPKDTDNDAGCILPASDPNVKCFKAGDVRVNQQPALITLHTIWMREHNRLVDELLLLNPDWSDEELYQEARKIVGAMLQHITYNEYLPDILGHTAMTTENLSPLSLGYFTGYDSSQNPAITNSFAAAAFRFGHSKVHDSLAYHGSAGNSNHLFKDIFLKPDLLYGITNGVTPIARGLVETRSQKVDRYMSTQLTQHMFERQPGTGLDLAALNIQRGRDHGIASYAIWRLVCGLSLVSHFGTGTGGLVDHNPTVAASLQSVYQSVYDIDLFSGAVSEIPVSGGKLGPTFTCLVSKQFKRLKFGDRFYYESNNPNTKFTPGQLDAIRGESMAKVICRNTDIASIQSNVFLKQAPGNPAVNCNSIPALDLSEWQVCIDGGYSAWSSWSTCIGGYKIRNRYCNNPVPNACGQTCTGAPFEVQTCLFSGTVNIAPDRVVRTNVEANLRRFSSSSLNSVLRKAILDASRGNSASVVSNRRASRLSFN